MENMGLVILAQAVILLVFCLGPILMLASWIRKLGRRRTQEEHGRRRAP